MTLPKNLDPFTSPKAFYGAELRRCREEAHLSQEQLGERVFCSGTYIGQFETAIRRPQAEFSQMFDDTFGLREYFQRLCRLAQEAEKHPEYFARAAELERLAETISEYAPVLVPGLLQTERYARALTRATLPLAPESEIEEHVQARMERQQILNTPTSTVLWVILYEAVLRAPVGGPEVIREQLAHIAALSRERRVLVQVLPFAAIADGFINSMASIMTFANAPTVAYAEGAHIGQLIEEPTLVERYQASYDLVRAAALSPTASLSLIESAAEDYTTS